MRNWKICDSCKSCYYVFDAHDYNGVVVSLYECGVATLKEELSSYNSKEDWINELPIPENCPFKLEQIVMN